MTVRQITKTTVSAAIFVAAFVFFRLYYVVLLSKLASLIHNFAFLSKAAGFFYITEDYPLVINAKLSPVGNIGAYFVSLFYFCVVVILIVRTLNAILNHKAALGFLSSYVQPLILTAVISILLLIDKLNILQMWAVFYVFVLICLNSTYKMILSNSNLIGSYRKLKEIKNFVIAFINTIKSIKFNGVKSLDNPIDDIVILLAALGILLLQVITLFSFASYMLTHWRLIFLSSLAGSL